MTVGFFSEIEIARNNFSSKATIFRLIDPYYGARWIKRLNDRGELTHVLASRCTGAIQ